MINRRLKTLSRLFPMRRLPVEGVVSKEYIARFLPRNAVIVEAGAHVGHDTKEWSELLPDATIHAFEPIPALYEQLVRNTSGLGNVRHYPLALSDKCGTATMFVSDGQSNASSSLLSPRDHLVEHPNVHFQSVIEVPTTTLDWWVEDNNIARVDFLWLDMQGHELSTMIASPRVMRTAGTVYTEVFLKELYADAPLYSEVRSWLEQQGFRLVSEQLPWPDAGNVLFTRRRELECIDV